MKIRNILAAGSIAALVVVPGAVEAVAAHAATNTCIEQESCGGADLAYTGHGNLSFAVLNPDANTNGGFGYNDEPVGFTTSGASDGSQDFSLVTDTLAGAGQYGYGEDLIEYTPGGQHPASGDIAMCVSVEDYYPTVGGKVVQRWGGVLRNCDAMGSTVITNGVNGTNSEASVVDPDPYQLWAPVPVPGPYLQFEDVALNSQHYRHGYGGSDFVLDDKGYGGNGSRALAFPNHFGLNQEGTVDGCTPPITAFNSKDFNCTTVTPLTGVSP